MESVQVWKGFRLLFFKEISPCFRGIQATVWGEISPGLEGIQAVVQGKISPGFGRDSGCCSGLNQSRFWKGFRAWRVSRFGDEVGWFWEEKRVEDSKTGKTSFSGRWEGAAAPFWDARRTIEKRGERPHLREIFPEQPHQVKEEEKVQSGEEEEEFSRSTYMTASWRRAHHNRTIHWDFMPLQRYPHGCKLKRNSLQPHHALRTNRITPLKEDSTHIST